MFDGIIEKKIGSYISYLYNPIPKSYIPYEDGSEESPPSLPDDADPVEPDGNAVFEKYITNNLIQSEVNLPQGDKAQGFKVIGSTK